MPEDKDALTTQTDNDFSESRRDSRFWLVFVANLMVDFLPAFDLTAIATALPAIVENLRASNFIWVGSAYTIASTASIPLIGGLASTIGRKPVLLGSIVLFALGSAISGSAVNMNMLISGRVVQGIGGGGCLSITEIIYSDLVPLPERGKFLGIIASVWALACAIGPPIGGSLGQSHSWRWLFYLNIPICGLAFILSLLFLKVRAPREPFKNMVKEMDWLGLLLIISGTTALSLALAWGGNQFPWTSFKVLVPLIVGPICILSFLALEFTSAKYPTIPRFILNRTTLSGYTATLIHGLVSMAAIFYLPVYFQACKLSSPVRSGVDILSLALIIPFVAILTGVSIEYFKRYRVQNFIGWVFIIVGFGLLTLLHPDSRTGAIVSFQIVLGIGLGILWISTQFPVMAPLPFSNNSRALSFFTFVRVLAQNWGTVIGGATLQNTLAKGLPSGIVTSVSGSQSVYALIREIPALSAVTRLEVQSVFANGLRNIWYTMIGISSVGLFSCVVMQEVEMRKALDETWGLQQVTTRNAEGSGIEAEKNVTAASS